MDMRTFRQLRQMLRESVAVDPIAAIKHELNGAGARVTWPTTDIRRTKFILPDGSTYGGQGITHDLTLLMLTDGHVHIDDALRAGVIRVNYGTSVEIAKPITSAQASVLADAAKASPAVAFGVDVNDPATMRGLAHRFFDSDRISSSIIRTWVNAQFN